MLYMEHANHYAFDVIYMQNSAVEILSILHAGQREQKCSKSKYLVCAWLLKARGWLHLHPVKAGALKQSSGNHLQTNW